MEYQRSEDVTIGRGVVGVGVQKRDLSTRQRSGRQARDDGLGKVEMANKLTFMATVIPTVAEGSRKDLSINFEMTGAEGSR